MTAKEILGKLVENWGEQKVLDLLPQHLICKEMRKLYSLYDVAKLHKIGQPLFNKWVKVGNIYPPDVTIKKRQYYSAKQLQKLNDQMAYRDPRFSVTGWIGPKPKQEG